MIDRGTYCVRVRPVGAVEPAAVWVDAPDEQTAITTAMRAPAAQGAVAEVTVQRYRICTACDGAGQAAETPSRRVSADLLDEIRRA